MSEKIEPALSAQEWRRPCATLGGSTADHPLLRVENGALMLSNRFRGWTDDVSLEDPLKIIALANAALPDSDPRKITREKILELRSIIRTHEADRGADESDSLAFLDALESYLPPLTVADKAA